MMADPLLFMRGVLQRALQTPTAKQQLCNLAKDRKWRLANTVESCCSDDPSHSPLRLLKRRHAYAACTEENCCSTGIVDGKGQ